MNGGSDVPVGAILANIELPDLLLSQKITRRPPDYQEESSIFSIYAYTLKDNKILATPYRLANVFDGGNICFGSFDPPKNPKEAVGTFFGSPFNDDDSLFHKQHASICGLAVHDFLDHIECCCGAGDDMCEACCDCECCYSICSCLCECSGAELETAYQEWLESYHLNLPAKDDITKLVCGQRFISSPEHVDAIFLSDRSELLEQLPRRKHRTGPASKKLAIGMATDCSEHWSVDFGQLTLDLPKEKTERV